MAHSTKPELLKASALTPELRAFIDHAIVPALVKEWLAEYQQKNSLAPETYAVDNHGGSSLVSGRVLSAEEGVTP